MDQNEGDCLINHPALLEGYEIGRNAKFSLPLQSKNLDMAFNPSRQSCNVRMANPEWVDHFSSYLVDDCSKVSA